MGEQSIESRAAAAAGQRPPKISFVERLDATAQQLEDLDTARLVTRFQAGDRDAFATIYSRHFDRVYGYLKVAVKSSHEAEDLAQQVFMNLFEALPRYERRKQPFRAWLFVLVRNQAISSLRKHNNIDVEDPAQLDRRREGAGLNGGEDTLPVLDWITDRDLMIFVERLPLPQRQVLLLRYMLDLSNNQIAEILDRTPMDVGKLHHRAFTFLRDRLQAVGRAPEQRHHPAQWRRRTTRVQVLRSRRFALTWRT
ncbi:MAG: polymerase sigma-70 factor, subfamily [Solirubrobacterales bacterium]|nr:polymerase sigma-70 factor, subfamily [Solirubrobacterales bacterium]